MFKACSACLQCTVQSKKTEREKMSKQAVPTGAMKQTVTTGSNHASDQGKNAGTSSAECEHMTTPLNSSVQDMTTAGRELLAFQSWYSAAASCVPV